MCVCVRACAQCEISKHDHSLVTSMSLKYEINKFKCDKPMKQILSVLSYFCLSRTLNRFASNQHHDGVSVRAPRHS